MEGPWPAFFLDFPYFQQSVLSPESPAFSAFSAFLPRGNDLRRPHDPPLMDRRPSGEFAAELHTRVPRVLSTVPQWPSRRGASSPSPPDCPGSSGLCGEGGGSRVPPSIIFFGVVGVVGVVGGVWAGECCSPNLPLSRKGMFT